MPDEEQPPGPLTLEEAEQWLLRIEDIATIERDLGSATRLVLINLVVELDRSGAIDGSRFVDRLTAGLPRIEARNEKLAAEQLVGHIAAALLGDEPDAPTH